MKTAFLAAECIGVEGRLRNAWATSRPPRLASNSLHSEPLHEYTQFTVQ
jgi:hypothetical protein